MFWVTHYLMACFEFPFIGTHRCNGFDKAHINPKGTFIFMGVV